MKRKTYTAPDMQLLQTDTVDILTASVNTEPFLADILWEGLY